MHHITGNTSSAPAIGQLIVFLLVNSRAFYWSGPDAPIGQLRILLLVSSGSSYS
jgi:hypothetical protein